MEWVNAKGASSRAAQPTGRAIRERHASGADGAAGGADKQALAGMEAMGGHGGHGGGEWLAAAGSARSASSQWMRALALRCCRRTRPGRGAEWQGALVFRGHPTESTPLPRPAPLDHRQRHPRPPSRSKTHTPPTRLDHLSAGPARAR